MIDFSLLLSLTMPRGSWILLPNMFFFFLKNITRFTLFIYLFTLEFIRFICKLFVSNLLKSFVVVFFHCASFSITSFLLQYLRFLFLFVLLFCTVVGVISTTSLAASFAISFCSYLTATTGGCNCTKRKLSHWFQYPA